MTLDLRIPIGLMFTLTGVVLAAFGFATKGNAALYDRSLGIDANLWWGIVLLIFGQIMFQTGRRALKRLENLPPPKPGKSTRTHR